MTNNQFYSKVNLEVEEKERIITSLQMENQTIRLALEERDEKINELEKWVSVLSELQSTPDSEQIVESIK